MTLLQRYWFHNQRRQPCARFRRALASGNPTVATAAAAELPRLGLADALANGEHVPAAEALAALLDAYGLAHEEGVLRTWLDDAPEGRPPPTN